MSSKSAWPLSRMLRRIESAVSGYPKAAMFALREEGFTTVFQQLVACVISIRTLDEVSGPAAVRLLQKAPDPRRMLRLDVPAIADVIAPAQFGGQKAATILGIARAAEAAGGELTDDPAVLMEIKGIGPKCANLAAGVAGGRALISVDSHVHRVVNRWGMVQTATPEGSLAALEEIVPEKLRIDINRLLMPFGKHICTWRLPHCSTCPVLEWCRRVGVDKSR